ncbi:MAG: hypothetical protein IJ649_06470 [Oscillospiraceae bacterium]|nr:hypothetical protein [Oscillospiraceae bacterium]
MGLFDGLFGKKDNGSGKSDKSSASYAPSVKGEPRQLYFLTDTGTAKVGHRMEDVNKKVLYEAKVTKFSLVGATGMDFIDHVKGTTTPHQVGHEIETDYHSILIDNHSGFRFDGEDIWKHLKRNGVVIQSSFMSGKPLWPQYRVLRDGEEIAVLQSSGVHVHEEDAAGDGKLAKMVPARGYFRIQTREKNLDLLFVVAMAFARTSALDGEGGSFGLLFGKK